MKTAAGEIGAVARSKDQIETSGAFFLGLWRLSDPKVSLASFASMLLGASLAAQAVPISWGWLALTVFGIFALEVAKNASGEIFDFDSGADLGVADEDRSPFSGGKRVLVDKLLTRRQTTSIAAAGYIFGSAAGFVIAFWREPHVLWIGLLGVACAYFYHAPPFKLSYRGWGELAVGVCYGPLICLGTYLVQTRELQTEVILVSLPLGLLIAAFLWINEFPDEAADRAANKRTLVVRLGRPHATRVFVVIQVIAFACLTLLPLAGLPKTVWLGTIAMLPAAFAIRRLLRNPDTTREIIPAQVATLATFLAYSLSLSAGVWL